MFNDHSMLRYLTAGESHGEAIIGVLEGAPAQLPLTPDDINEHLARRWLGYGRGGRSKIENDTVHIYSGVRFGKTLGSPISFRIDNGAYEKDKAGWPEKMAIEGEPPEDMEKVTMPRPGHADLAGKQKYEHDDMRPVIDRSSARETAMRVACCSVARRLLNEFGIEVGSHVVRIGDVGFDEPEEWADRRNALIEEGGGASALYETADESATRMIDDGMTERCVEHIDQTKKDRDSLGGVYEVVVTGVPPGLGSYVHWDRRLDGQLVQAICSIQAQKAAEVGDGFFNAHRPGSQVHDPIEPREDGAQAYPRGRHGRGHNHRHAARRAGLHETDPHPHQAARLGRHGDGRARADPLRAERHHERAGRVHRGRGHRRLHRGQRVPAEVRGRLRARDPAPR